MSHINLNNLAFARNFRLPNTACFKGKLGELQLYFRKLPLHQQNFLVVSVLSNSPWVAEKFENISKMKLLSSFQLAIRFYSNGASICFLCLLRDDMN